MSSISCYVRLSRPPLVRLRQRRVPALPACHISATFCARARSHARRIRPSMCEARATARAPRYRCIRDPCSHCLLPCLRTTHACAARVAGCVAPDLRLEETANCMQAQAGGMVLELIGHVAEPRPKRKRRSLARMPHAWRQRVRRMQARSRDGSYAPSCAPLHRPIGPVAILCGRGLPLPFLWSACVHVFVWSRASAASPCLRACPRCRWVHSVMDLMVRIVS
jgi:hypothetical protein